MLAETGLAATCVTPWMPAISVWSNLKKIDIVAFIWNFHPVTPGCRMCKIIGWLHGQVVLLKSALRQFQ